MHVFVTGGNGFIGSVVVKSLLNQSHQVRCLLRSQSNTDRLKGLNFERVIGDVRDLRSLEKGVAGCDTVIHLASLSSWNDINSPLMNEVVVSGSKNMISAAKKAHCRRLVFVSSVAAINGTTTPEVQSENSPCTLNLNKLVYARVKRQVEEMCVYANNNGLETVIVNPGEVYGPNDSALITAGNLIDFAKNNPALVCEGGTSVVFIDDVAKGIIAAAQRGKPGERYILGGENLSVRELAVLTLDILGKKTKILGLPNWILKAAGATAQKLRLPFPINPNVIPYATRFWYMDNSKAKKELGVTFRDARKTLTPTINWLKETNLV